MLWARLMKERGIPGNHEMASPLPKLLTRLPESYNPKIIVAFFMAIGKSEYVSILAIADNDFAKMG
ncbi:MAG: hypothetical protein ACRERU_05885 [Methylococcales bacterium]